MLHLNEKAVTCKRTEHQNAPACICFSLHFVQRGSSMRNQSSDRINTNSKHAEEETNKMLRNQEVKWCQSRGELTPNALLNLLSISIEVYMQKNVYLIQMVSKTSVCHIQLDSNMVLKSYAFPVQQTFWEQN